jgi:class 3 adenylate cyclase
MDLPRPVTDLHLDDLGLTEIIRLQNRLSGILRRRFTRSLALCFTDIVDAAAYFAQFGDEAGRRLQQRHIDLLERALAPHGGRVVDTAGDGAFSCFPAVEAGAGALLDFFQMLRDDNAASARDDELRVRAGLHWGDVLTDGAVVSGEAVNLCARVCLTGSAGEIRLTLDAFHELPNALKLRCRRMRPLSLKGFSELVVTLVLAWRSPSVLPVAVRIAETGQEIPLPALDAISFGRRSDDEQSWRGDKIVLAAADPTATRGISRLHFELRRQADGFVLSPTSAGLTEVDGRVVPMGSSVRVGPGTAVRVSRVLTLTFVESVTGDAPSLLTARGDAPPTDRSPGSQAGARHGR